MKHAIISMLIFLVLTIIVKSNTPEPIVQSDSIKNNSEVVSLLKELEKKLNEKNYTRIPNEDFENIIGTKISKQVDDKFTFWFTTIGVIFTFLGGVAVFAARKYVSDEINKRIKSESQILVTALREELSEDLNRLRKFQDESKKIIYGVELQTIKQDLQYNRKLDKTVDLNRLLIKCDEISDDSLVKEVIDELVRSYYYQKNHNEIEKIIEQYSPKYKFFAPTWVNAALLYLDEFESFGAKQQKERGLEYLDKSLLVTPGYGEALGLKLVTYMIKFDRAKTEDEKLQIKETTLNLISEINISYAVSADETVDRLIRDRKSNIYKKYVDTLYDLFPSEMKKMHEIADGYLETKKNTKID